MLYLKPAPDYSGFYFASGLLLQKLNFSFELAKRLDGPMNLFPRILYGMYRNSVKLYQRLFIETHVWGRDRIPPGPKIFVGNHISSHDGFWFTPTVTEPVHYVIGPGYDSWIGAKFLNAFESINALSPDAHTVVEQSVKYLNKGEAVAIAPEGDLNETFSLGRFMPGVARIYLASRVPIVPFALLAPRRCLSENPKKRQVINGHVYRMVNVRRGPYCVSFGKPWSPTYDGLSETKQIVRITRELRDRIESLVEDMRINKFWLES